MAFYRKIKNVGLKEAIKFCDELPELIFPKYGCNFDERTDSISKELNGICEFTYTYINPFEEQDRIEEEKRKLQEELFQKAEEWYQTLSDEHKKYVDLYRKAVAAGPCAI